MTGADPAAFADIGAGGEIFDVDSGRIAPQDQAGSLNPSSTPRDYVKIISSQRACQSDSHARPFERGDPIAKSFSFFGPCACLYDSLETYAALAATPGI